MEKVSSRGRDRWILHELPVVRNVGTEGGHEPFFETCRSVVLFMLILLVCYKHIEGLNAPLDKRGWIDEKVGKRGRKWGSPL